VLPRKPTLPIDAILPEIIASLDSKDSKARRSNDRHSNLVIEAPPGAGKTTRVPPALLGIVTGDVVVLEPRRIAARLAARRVAWEMGEQPGETVGYQVRFEEAVGPRTRLRFVTEGVLTRRLLSDPFLRGVGAVVLDEFHERHLESDLALALLKRLQRTRPDLRIVVMSATLDAAPVAQYLGGCPVIRSEGTRFELSIKHLPYSPKPLEVQVRDAAELLIGLEHSGDILVFLPGAAEIRRAMRECEAVARRTGLLILPLHGSLSPKEQDRALAPAPQRKLILATNVAESSVTVEGVTAVIDGGLARVATYSPWSGLPTLHVGRVSKASAKQRAGRAGRTAPGRVLRLYTEEDYLRRPEQDAPEILRVDLSQLCLDLRAMQISNVNDLDWLDAPPLPSVETAEALLNRLGVTDDGVMDGVAQRLARYPLPPGCREFSSKRWSAVWARTAAWLRRCWDRACTWKRMISWRRLSWKRTTACGSISSSFAELRALPDRRIITTTLCSCRCWRASRIASRGGAQATKSCCRQAHRRRWRASLPGTSSWWHSMPRTAKISRCRWCE